MILFNLGNWWLSAAAVAAPIQLGVGVIDNPTPWFTTPGLRVSGRYQLDELTLEAGLIYRPDLGSNGLADLVHTLVAIANEGSGQMGFQQPADLETIATTVLAQWSFGNLSHSTGLTGGPTLMAGVQAGVVNQYYARYDSSLADGPPTTLEQSGSSTLFGPVIGMGFELQFNETYGLRFGKLHRSYYQLKPQYDPDVLVDEAELSGQWGNFVDLTVQLGGRP